MTDVSQQQLDLVRTTPQGAELHLSIYRPPTILACQVDDSTITKGARTITYSNISSGSYINIVSGMTLLVGTAPGLSDLGKVRVRSASDVALVVAENSDVRWQNEAYLTVLNLIRIVPIFPRIIQDPNNAENTLWYKDYDIEYDNQNSILGSFVCMGPHRAGNLGDDGKCSFFFSATGTSHVGKDDISYSWNFPGASNITSSTDLTPGWVEYQSPQHTVAILTVTSVQGSEDISYRYVSVYNHNKNSQGWEISNIQGSRQAGGYQATILIHTPWEYEIYDGAPVVIYKNSWYGNVYNNLGGNAYNCGDIYFSGYILDGSIKWDYEKSTVEFQVGSTSDVMKDISGFAISVENSLSSPVTWYQIQGQNLKKAIYHFLRWHSTVLKVTDFQFLASDRYVQFFDSDRGSIYDGVASFLKSALLGELVTDRQGKLWAETSMDATDAAKSVYLPKFTLSKTDWINEPNIQELFYDVLSYLEMGGIKYNPNLVSEKASVAYLACAPGITPSTHGRIEAPSGLALLSQEELNQIVGNVFAAKNAKKPQIDFEFKGQYLTLDIAPLEALQVLINPEDTSRNCAINAPYFIHSLKGNYLGDQQYLRTGATLKEITEGVPGDTIIIPDTPPDESDDFTEDIPTFPLIPIIPTTPSLANIVAILVGGYGVYHFNFFSDGTYEWVSDNDSFTPEEKAALIHLETALGSIYTGTTKEVFKIDTTTSIRTTIGTEEFFTNYIPESGEPYHAVYHVEAIGTDPTSGAVAVLAGRVYPAALTASFTSGGGDLEFSQIQPIDIESGCHLIGHAGFWYYTGNEGIFYTSVFRRFSSDMGNFEYDLAVGGPQELMEVHPVSADYIFLRNGSALIVRTDKGETLVRNDGDVSDYDCDPTGQYLMYVADDQIYYSSDQAISWISRHTTLPCPYIRSGRVLNLGTPNDWIVSFINPESGGAPSTNIWMTADAGLSWTNCLGNLFELGVPVNGTIVLMRRA